MSFRKNTVLCGWVVLLNLGFSLLAQGLPLSEPGTVGLSSSRLTRVDRLMEDYVERGIFPGMTVSVSKKGKIAYLRSFGYSDIETKTPVRSDSIFRIFSMTKPITSVAVMILFEEGRFMLDDPVSLYIPEFKDLEVYSPDGDQPLALDREITIRDLLRQTSGLGYGWGDDPVSELYKKANLWDSSKPIEAMVDKLVTLPLYFQPGTKWRYSVSIDVLGRLVEVLSGQTLASFFQEHIFDPLGMVDTGFHVPSTKISQFTNAYNFNEDKGLVALPPLFAQRGYEADQNKLYSGGGGLVSTSSDYMRFAQMLVNGGELDGKRILGRKTVELMSSNHLPKGVESDWPKMKGHGYGFAVSVLTDVAASPTVGTVGDWGWDGLASTYVRVDPEEDLVILLMTHRMPCDTEIQVKLKTLVYQAIVD